MTNRIKTVLKLICDDPDFLNKKAIDEEDDSPMTPEELEDLQSNFLNMIENFESKKPEPPKPKKDPDFTAPGRPTVGPGQQTSLFGPPEAAGNIYGEGRLLVKDCPVCRRDNPVSLKACRYCKKIYNKIKSLKKRFPKFTEEQVLLGISKTEGTSLEALKGILSSEGETPLTPQHAVQTRYSNRKLLDHLLNNVFNIRRDKVTGKAVYDEETGFPVPSTIKTHFSTREIATFLRWEPEKFISEALDKGETQEIEENNRVRSVTTPVGLATPIKLGLDLAVWNGEKVLSSFPERIKEVREKLIPQEKMSNINSKIERFKEILKENQEELDSIDETLKSKSPGRIIRKLVRLRKQLRLKTITPEDNEAKEKYEKRYGNLVDEIIKKLNAAQKRKLHYMNLGAQLFDEGQEYFAKLHGKAPDIENPFESDEAFNSMLSKEKTASIGNRVSQLIKLNSFSSKDCRLDALFKLAIDPSKLSEEEITRLRKEREEKKRKVSLMTPRQKQEYVMGLTSIDDLVEVDGKLVPKDVLEHGHTMPGKNYLSKTENPRLERQIIRRRERAEKEKALRLNQKIKVRSKKTGEILEIKGKEFDPKLHEKLWEEEARVQFSPRKREYEGKGYEDLPLFSGKPLEMNPEKEEWTRLCQYCGEKISEDSEVCWACKSNVEPNVIRMAVRKWVPTYKTIREENKEGIVEDKKVFDRMIPMGSLVSLKLDESGNPESASCEQLTISQEEYGSSEKKPRFKDQWKTIEKAIADPNLSEEKKAKFKKYKDQLYIKLVADRLKISEEEAKDKAWRFGKSSRTVAYAPSGKPCKMCPEDVVEFDKTCAEIQGAINALSEDSEGPWEYKIKEYIPGSEKPKSASVQVWRYEDIRKIRRPEKERPRGKEKVKMMPVPADDKIASRFDRIYKLSMI